MKVFCVHVKENGGFRMMNEYRVGFDEIPAIYEEEFEFLMEHPNELWMSQGNMCYQIIERRG